MKIIYTGPNSSDSLWHNDSPPAINETNLNQIEREIRDLVNEVNEYVVPVETELTNLSLKEGTLLTGTQANILNNIQKEIMPGTKDYDSYLSNIEGIKSYVGDKVNNLNSSINNVSERVSSVEKALPSVEGKILPLKTVATTGDYNDLINKLKPGANITISADNTISATGGGGDIPTGLASVAYTGNFYDLVNYPNPDDYEIVANKVTTITKNSTDEDYPSAKAVYSLLGDIEAALAKL